MQTRPKYIFVNGVMKLNPDYQAENSNHIPPSTIANPQDALAVISTPQDIISANQSQQMYMGTPSVTSESTAASMGIMQDAYFLNKFETSTQMQPDHVIEGLTKQFARYEIPIGMINKLLALMNYQLNFIIDDSASMNESSDVTFRYASDHIKRYYDPQGFQANNYMSRWHEAEDRLHILIDILAYIPTNKITIHFFNRQNMISLDHSRAHPEGGKTPEDFALHAHEKIRQAFSMPPNNDTPIHKKLMEAFQIQAKTMHYLFTDGIPTRTSVEDVVSLICNRPNPEMRPLTLISCTNNPEDLNINVPGDPSQKVNWMKFVDVNALYVAEIDDFESERNEVLENQGSALPFSRGAWEVCQLVAAINPSDLDAIDEPVPFTKKTLDDYQGRKLTPQEYQHYWEKNAKAKAIYGHLFSVFQRENLIADQIVDRRTGQIIYNQGQVWSSNPSTYQPNHWNQQAHQAPYGATTQFNQTYAYSPQSSVQQPGIYSTNTPSFPPPQLNMQASYAMANSHQNSCYASNGQWPNTMASSQSPHSIGSYQGGYSSANSFWQNQPQGNINSHQPNQSYQPPANNQAGNVYTAGSNPTFWQNQSQGNHQPMQQQTYAPPTPRY